MHAGSSPVDTTPQALVDALSVAVGRPVLLDDPQLTPIAHSAQWETDEVRRRSILSRGPSDAVRGALFGQGIAEAADLVHTDSDPGLGMEGRVCMPVRAGGELLGYLWLLDPRQDLGEEQLEQVRRTAAEVAPLLAAAGREIGEERGLLEGLRSSSSYIRRRAAAELHDRRLLAGEDLVLCLVAATAAGADPVRAVKRAARRLSVGHAIAAGAAEGAALLVSLGDPVLHPMGEGEIATWLFAGGEPGLAVGQSGPAAADTLDVASHQAELALRVARSRADGEAAAAWSALGADRLVAQLPAGARRDFPPPLLRLIADEPALTETLAGFLDAGGDVKATAAALSLHRSGLYYRLRRIEEITGLDLDDGDDRLLAHLVIRTERLFR